MLYLPFDSDVAIVNASDLIHIDPANLQRYPFFGHIESIEIRGSLLAIKGPIEKLIQKCYTIVKAHSGHEVLPKSWTKVMRQSHFEFCIGQDLTHSIFL